MVGRNFHAENPNPVIRINPEGDILVANRASNALLREWGIEIGGKLPAPLIHLAAASFKNRKKITVDVESGRRIYSFVIVPIPKCGYINLYGTDITRRKQIEKMQMFLIACGWPASGENFFTSLARYLAQTLGMDYVCIDRLLGDGLSAETVAVYFDGKYDENVTYALKDTPCSNVVGKTVCAYPKGVRHLFPRDVVLQEMMAEGYVGTTLWSAQGQPIGLIAMISRQPLAGLHLAESLLKLAAVRAAGELERIKAEETLRANEKQLRQAHELLEAVTEGSRILVATVDRDLCYTFFNKEHHEEMRRITGKDTAIGMSLMEVLADLPDQLKSAIDPWNRALKGETVVQTLEFGDPERYHRYYRTRHVPICNSEGVVVGAGEVTADITELMMSQDALRVSEERLRLAQAGANMGIWDWNLEKDELLFTAELENLYGLAPGTIRTYEDWRKLAHPDDIERIEAEREAAVANRRSFDLEFRIFHSSGEIRWINAKGGALFNEAGEVVRLLGVNVDITKRKRAEEALFQSEEKYRTLFETMTQGVVYQDANGRIISANRAAERILGMTQDQLMGHTSMDPKWRAVREDGTDFPGEEHPMVIARKTGQPVLGAVTGIFNPTVNEYRWVTVSAIPQFRPGGTKPYQVYAVFDDITERKRAEESVLVSEIRYRRLFEAARDGILILDAASGRIVDANPFLKEMLGYSLDELLNKKLWEIGLFKHIVASKEAFLELQKKGFIRYENLPLETKDGRQIAVEFVSNVYLVDGGEVIQCNIRDITKRFEAEEALRDSEERYKLAQRAAGIGTWDWDIRTGRLKWSEEVAKLFGTSLERFNGTMEEFKTIVHPEDLSKVQTTIDACIKDGSEYSIVHRIVLEDGSIRWMWEMGDVIKNEKNQAERMLGVVMDVTAVRKSDEERARLAEIVGASWDAIIGSSPDGVVTSWNPGAERMFGYTEKEMIGHPFSLIVPLDQLEEFSEVLQRMRRGKKIGYTEAVRKTKSGKTINVSLSLFPITDADGTVIALSSIERDITHRKQMEEALRKSRNEMEQRIKERTAELERVNQTLQIEVSEKELTQKELRSLTAILAKTEERERRRIATDLHDRIIQTLVYANMKLGELRESAAGTSSLKTADEVSQYVQQTIHDLRTLTFELSPPVLYELGFVPAVKWLIRQFEEKHDLVVEFQEHYVPETIDEDVRIILFQALRELLTNTVKHARARCIKVTLYRDENMLKTIIEDDGVGFDSGKITMNTKDNTGFGIFNIRQRLESVSGGLSIESRPGAGTRIEMIAPLLS